MKKSLRFVGSLIFHGLALGGIMALFWPLGEWYFSAAPIWGVDFYYTASLVALLKQAFSLPPGVWNYSWFAGVPYLWAYPILHYYFVLPLTAFTDLLSAVKLGMIVSAGLFIFGCYALSYVISKSRVLAIILAVATAYSIGVYGALTWGGSLPSFATQAFYPWILTMVVLHLKTERQKFLWLASLLAGLAIWGHPQIVIAYIFPSVFFLYAFWLSGASLWRRIKSFALFSLLLVAVGLPIIYRSGGPLSTLIVTDASKVAASTGRLISDSALAIARFNESQPLRILTDTQPLFFVFLPLAFLLWVISLFFRAGRKEVGVLVPFVIIAVWYIVYIWLFSKGISIYHGGWYRLFWSVPVWMGMLISALLWPFFKAVPSIFGWLVNGVLLSLAAAMLFFVRPDAIAQIVKPDSFGEHYYSENEEEIIARGTFSLLAARSEASSAYPDVLSLPTNQQGIDQLKRRLVPTWLDPTDVSYRLYDADQTVNLWWSALYPMPLARGYLDVPTRAHRGYAFWVDASLNQDQQSGDHQLVGAFDYPEEAANNNTLFLIDWYAIRYFEAAHESPTVYSPLPKFLTEPHFMKQEERLDFNQEKFRKGSQELHYYEIQSELVSPILMGSNALTLGIVASDQGYETLVRGIADANLGVRTLVPIKLGKQLDKLGLADLNGVDALVLYDYDYTDRRRAFRMVEEFAKAGKNVFIDSGIETKESRSLDLPSIFPFEQSIRGQLGAEWDFDIEDNALTQDIDFARFDPSVFDGDPWKFSYPDETTGLRSGAEVLLRNHSKPLLATYPLGAGKIVWSGFNLPYHATRTHNMAEIAFISQIFHFLLPDLGLARVAPEDRAEFISPRERKITTHDVRGVLFKEQAYPGWKAWVKVAGKERKASILKVGPGSPGFMYVPLEGVTGPVEVRFVYKGSQLGWWLFGISALVSTVLLEQAVFGGHLSRRTVGRFKRMAHAQLKKWWNREDEE